MTTRTATRTVLLVSATSSDPANAPGPDEVVDALVSPSIARFGGRVEGVYEDRIVASFPDETSATSAAAELTRVLPATWAVR